MHPQISASGAAQPLQHLSSQNEFAFQVARATSHLGRLPADAANGGEEPEDMAQDADAAEGETAAEGDPEGAAPPVTIAARRSLLRPCSLAPRVPTLLPNGATLLERVVQPPRCTSGSSARLCAITKKTETA